MVRLICQKPHYRNYNLLDNSDEIEFIWYMSSSPNGEWGKQSGIWTGYILPHHFKQIKAVGERLEMRLKVEIENSE